MVEFSLKIAGHTAAVSSLFESTPAYFHAYLSQDTPEFSIAPTWEDLAFEQADLLEEAHRDGFKPRVFTDPFLERAAIQRAFSEFLFDFHTLLFHGSAIAVDGEGFLFTANSGTGKSTHTRLWREAFGSRATMVNDDKPFLQITKEQILAHGSPWSGKHGLDANICVRLKGICILQRGAQNRIRRAAPEEVLPILQKQAYRPLRRETHPAFLPLVDTLAQQVPLWHMTCTKDPEAAAVAYHAMHTD